MTTEPERTLSTEVVTHKATIFQAALPSSLLARGDEVIG
jgi:hypothetical protein